MFTVARNGTVTQRKNGAWALLNQLHNEKLNAWYLTTLSNGLKFYLFTIKPAPGNKFDGFRLRSTPLYDGFFKSLGAHPVRMAPPAVYTALERGTVDGYGWPSWGIGDFGWVKFTKYQYGPGFFTAAVPILVNLDRWRSLSDDQRQCLTDMAVWVEKVWPDWRAAESKSQTAVLKKAGVKYVDLGPEFSSRAENMYWDQLEQANPSFVRKIKPLLLQAD